EMSVAIPGDVAFGDLFKTTGPINRIISALGAADPNAALNTELARLDAETAKVASAHSTIGARTNRLESLQELNGRQDDASRIALSKVEDVDFIKAAMDLSIQSNAYNAALQASAKMIQPSLMDFLR
ncbi:MAG TPA: flagellar hook-associated protein 3, partial [Dermatophilaceae bacterium]|nr:flagellar hook-associated protein 3 [Dermatophilaceae bacterium]